MGLVKLTIWDLRNKVSKIQGPGVGLAISPLLSLFLFLFFFGGGGLARVAVLVFIPGAFINLFGPPISLYYACIFKSHLDTRVPRVGEAMSDSDVWFARFAQFVGDLKRSLLPGNFTWHPTNPVFEARSFWGTFVPGFMFCKQ